jgi:hypothetical protein
MPADPDVRRSDEHRQVPRPNSTELVARAQSFPLLLAWAVKIHSPTADRRPRYMGRTGRQRPSRRHEPPKSARASRPAGASRCRRARVDASHAWPGAWW